MMKELSFEENIEKLNKIVETLEKGNLSLNDSFELFKEGIEISKILENMLNEMEGKITILVNQEEIEFHGEENDV
ncbi:MAG: exodeoxyribonuclease VII small subunit [Thermoanaerobacteraceae bacterium]